MIFHYNFMHVKFSPISLELYCFTQWKRWVTVLCTDKERRLWRHDALSRPIKFRFLFCRVYKEDLFKIGGFQVMNRTYVNVYNFGFITFSIVESLVRRPQGPQRCFRLDLEIQGKQVVNVLVTTVTPKWRQWLLILWIPISEIFEVYE